MTRSSASEQERIIGRYQLVAELGDGPLGMLWAAVVTSGAETGRVVAVRRLPEMDADARRRLRMAGDTAMQLRHPRLVALLDVVDEPRGIATVSEHVDGELLSVLLRSAAAKQAPLPPAIALRIAFDVLTALRAARDLWTKATPLTGPEPERLLRSVYGGVTPADIVVASYGDTVLSNVGIAGMSALVPSLGRHADFLAYRAPEQLEPNTIVDERADVFSIGVVIWEMLAHRPLFGSQARYHGVRSGDPSAESKEVEERVRGAGIPRIDAMARTGPPIPKTVVEIVARALERKPSDRFSTLEQMSEALRALSRESIATAEQVVVAIDRLAREAIDARRAALEMAVGYRAVSDSKPPPSNRTTQRPPPPQTPQRIVSDARLDARAFRMATAPALPGERFNAGFTPEEEQALDRQTLQPRVRSRPQRPLPPGRQATPQPPPIPIRAGAAPPLPPPRVPNAAFPAAPLAGRAEPATDETAADPAVSAARALFQPDNNDDFSELPTEAGADGVPPPPPALTRSKPPSAPPPAETAATKPEFELDTAASGAAISVSMPRAATKNRTVVVAIAAAAAVLIVAAILVFSRGSPEAPPAQTPTAAKADETVKQPAKEEELTKEAPALAPTPEVTAAPEAVAQPIEETQPVTEPSEPETPSEPTRPSEPVRRQVAPERAAPAPAKPKPKETFRPRGI